MMASLHRTHTTQNLLSKSFVMVVCKQGFNPSVHVCCGRGLLNVSAWPLTLHSQQSGDGRVCLKPPSHIAISGKGACHPSSFSLPDRPVFCQHCLSPSSISEEKPGKALPLSGFHIKWFSTVHHPVYT